MFVNMVHEHCLLTLRRCVVTIVCRQVETREVTDYGMRYDGQYWHYVDKWLLALARTDHVDEGVRIAKSCFPYFFSSSSGGGIRWKLSVGEFAIPPLYHPTKHMLRCLSIKLHIP